MKIAGWPSCFYHQWSPAPAQNPILGIIRACKCGAEWLLVRGKRLSKGHDGPNVSSHRSHSHRPQRSSNKLMAMMHETTQNTYARANEKIRGRGDTLRMFIFPDVSLACLHTPTFSVFAQSKRPRCFFSHPILVDIGQASASTVSFSHLISFLPSLQLRAGC